MWVKMLKACHTTLQVCNYDVAAAEKAYVYIDELDKIARKGRQPFYYKGWV